MSIGKVWVYQLLFVCFVFVCTVTDFSAENKASGIKFCIAVHRHPGQESPILGNFAPTEAPNRTNRSLA